MNRGGQTTVEYIIIIGIVITALYAMGPLFKRGTQSLIKATSDQLAAQNRADQDFSYDASHLDIMTTRTGTSSQRNVQETNYAVNTLVSEATDTFSNMTTNMGFSGQ